MRAADMPQMNILARKIFLNLEINQQKNGSLQIYRTVSNSSFKAKLPMVIPAGVEPAIFWMRTRRPRPLDDGTITSLILPYPPVNSQFLHNYPYFHAFAFVYVFYFIR